MPAEAIALPPGVAFAVIAFLLSLLPAGLFLWLWYLRRHDRPVPTGVVAVAFFLGIFLVLPAFKMEEWSAGFWSTLSPTTVHYFAGAVLPLQGVSDLLLPAVGTFLIVATVEEGLRFLLLWFWFQRAKHVDQVFDGLVLGIATGLGFATLENTLYFLNLFRTGSFDTLVFVFFLRFMISTMAHISFGGLMGTLLAKGVFQIYRPQRRGLIAAAFLIPWFLHGLYDLLLGVDQTTYAVLMLLPPLLVLIVWAGRREHFAIARQDGRVLVHQQAPVTRNVRVMRKVFQRFDSPWNVNAPWLRERRVRYNFLQDLESDS